MNEPTPAVPPSLPSAGPGGPSADPAAPGPWFVLRPFVALALLVVAMGTPLEAPWERILVAAAVVGIFGCAWPLLARPFGTPGRWVLGIGAVLAVLGPIAYANPWFGVDANDWPWTYWAESRRWVDRVDLLLWAVVSLLAVVAAASAGRATAAAALAAVVLLAARGFAERGALSLVRLERVNLIWTLAAGTLGGALLHLSSASPRGRGVARGLVVGAVAAIATVYAAWFPEQGGGERSSLWFYAEELPPIFGAAFRGAESDPTYVDAMTKQTWLVGVPFLLQAAAAGLALLVAAFPGRVRARPLRFVAGAAVLLLLATWLVPVRASFWFSRDVAEGARETRYAQAVGEVLMKAGLAVFLLMSGAVVALLGRSPAAPTPALAVPSSGRTRRGLYAAGAAGGAVVLWAATDFDALVPGAWNVALAGLTYRGAVVVAALLGLLLPAGRVRGGLALALVTLALGALTPSKDRWLGGVETYVVPVAAAVAAGAAVGGRTAGARAAAAGAALVVLALLLYPQPLPTEVARDGVVSVPFRTALLDDGIRDLAAAWGGADFGTLLAVPGRIATFGFALAAVTALLAAGLRAPRVGAVAVTVWLFLGILAPVASQVLGGGGGGAPDGLRTAGWRTADVLDQWSVPALLVLLASILDLFGPCVRGAPAGRASGAVPGPPGSDDDTWTRTPPPPRPDPERS